MVAEIETYLDQLLSIRQDGPGLVSGLTEPQLGWQPAPDRWSIAECFEHLNVTAGRFLPRIDAAIGAAGAAGLRSPGPFAYPVAERLFLRFNEPPPKLRVRAPSVFRPTPGRTGPAVVRDFLDWQDRIGERLRQADGLDLRRARGQSPALPLWRWSLGTMFAVLLAHERRHIWQARHVRNEPAFPA